MELYEVIKTRRNIKSYRKTPIPEDALNRILETERFAPRGARVERV